MMEKKTTRARTAPRLPGHGSLPLLLALSLLMLSQPLSAGISAWNPVTDVLNYKPACEATPASGNSAWVPLAFIAILASLFVIGIAYMVSMGLSIPKLTAWAKNELYQTIASALLIVMLVSALQMATAVSETIVPGGSLPAAKAYVVKMRNTLTADFVAISLVNNFVSAYASITINLMPGRMGIAFQVGPMLRPFLDALGLLMNGLITGIGAWAAHELVLCFIEVNMLTVFLPLGLFLRSFSFTRSAGGALIAIAVSFYFVYPLMLNFNEKLVEPKYRNMWNPGPGEGGWGVVGGVKSALMGMATGLIGAGWLTFAVMMFLGMATLVAHSFYIAVIGMLVPFMLAAGRQVFHSVLITTLILPFFNVFVTLTFAKELAKYLGADINLASLTQMI